MSNVILYAVSIAASSGSMIVYSQLGLGLSLQNVTFINNMAENEVYIDNTPTTITGGGFSNGTGRFIQAIGSTLSIT